MPLLFGGSRAEAALLRGATDFTGGKHWIDTVTPGQTLLATTWTTVVMVRMNETPLSSGRAFFGGGHSGAAGGWEWETRAANVVRVIVINAAGANRNADITLTLGKDYILIAQVTANLLSLYSHESGTAVDTSAVAGGILDNGSWDTSIGTNSTGANSQNPTDAITVYGAAHSADSLVSAGPGIVAYGADCIAQRKVVDFTGGDHLYNVPASLGPLVDEVGSHDLLVVGAPTLVGNVPDFA